MRQIGVENDDGLALQIRLRPDAGLASPDKDSPMHDHVRHGKIRECAAFLRLREIEQHVDPSILELLEKLPERPDA